jgi:hypothetical protein
MCPRAHKPRRARQRSGRGASSRGRRGRRRQTGSPGVEWAAAERVWVPVERGRPAQDACRFRHHRAVPIDPVACGEIWIACKQVVAASDPVPGTILLPVRARVTLHCARTHGPLSGQRRAREGRHSAPSGLGTLSTSSNHARRRGRRDGRGIGCCYPTQISVVKHVSEVPDILLPRASRLCHKCDTPTLASCLQLSIDNCGRCDMAQSPFLDRFLGVPSRYCSAETPLAPWWVQASL